MWNTTSPKNQIIKIKFYVLIMEEIGNCFKNKPQSNKKSSKGTSKTKTRR